MEIDLHNKDGVGCIFNTKPTDGSPKPCQLNYNNLYQVAWNLWSRDIKTTSDLSNEGRNIIMQQNGKESLEIIDKILDINWNKWQKDMEAYFSKQEVRMKHEIK